MTTAVNKIWLATGAFALAAAAVLTPLVAQADPANPTNPGIGSSAGAPTTKKGNSNRGSARPAPVAPGGVAPAAPGDVPPATPGDVAPAAPGTPAAQGKTSSSRRAAATGANPLFQNSLWWFGTPNPTPPPASYTRTFEPLAGLPGFSQSFFGWYRNLNFEACILGVGNTTVTSVGPYGTSTSSVSTNGC